MFWRNHPHFRGRTHYLQEYVGYPHRSCLQRGAAQDSQYSVCFRGVISRSTCTIAAYRQYLQEKEGQLRASVMKLTKRWLYSNGGMHDTPSPRKALLKRYSMLLLLLNSVKMSMMLNRYTLSSLRLMHPPRTRLNTGRLGL